MRKKPYTEIGVRRLKCYRCKTREASRQWQICADGNTFRPLCIDCDVALNRVVLHFMGMPFKVLIPAYRANLLSEARR